MKIDFKINPYIIMTLPLLEVTEVILFLKLPHI